MKNIGFYHHGAAPADDVKAALEKLPLRLSRRNALHFLPSDVEAFDTVVVDKGRNAKLIGDTYAGKKVPVVSIADFLAEFAKPAPITDRKAVSSVAPVVSADHEEGKVYEIDGAKYVCAIGSEDESGQNTVKGLVPITDLDAEALAELVAEGQLTNEDLKAVTAPKPAFDPDAKRRGGRRPKKQG